MSYLTTRLIIILGALSIVSACATRVPDDPELARIDDSKMPSPNLSLTIPGLSPCTSSLDPTIRLNSNEPVNVIVHGCFGSAARFRSLAQVFAFHGQQTVCFNYNDRDSLTKSSTELVQALDTLSGKLRARELTLIGHSQGGLISRKALADNRGVRPSSDQPALRLVTISAPFAGIAAAEHCASPVARLLSFGLVIPICKLISGDKWYEITRPSEFIQQPGPLSEQVTRHLKIVTDETGSCRRRDAFAVCLEEDQVFTLGEQYFSAIDSAAQVKNVEVAAGHTEIVGDHRVAPEKLIRLLQAEGIMRATPVGKRDRLLALLSRLYQ